MRNSRQAGLSLIELMIAITISFVVIGGLGTVFLGSRQSYRVQDSMSRLQESGRHAMDVLARDIRQAGYAGCARDASINEIASPATGFNPVTTGIRGYEGGTLPAELTSSEVVSGTDIIRLQFAAPGSAQITGNTTPANANIQLPSNPNGFIAGSIIMVTDCSSLDIFRATTVSNGSTVTIAHAMSSNSDNKLSKSYGPSAEIMAFQTVLYYIGTGAWGGPSLFVKRVAANGVMPAAGTELVEGVSNMQIVYGEDTNGDLAADRYRGASTFTNMDNVVSARLTLLMQSLTPVATQPQTYIFNNAAPVTPTDRFLRRVFSSTVDLRNRTP